MEQPKLDGSMLIQAGQYLPLFEN